MARRFFTLAMVLAIGAVVPCAHGQQRGRGEKPGAEKPGAESNRSKKVAKEGKPESEPKDKPAGEKQENEFKGGGKPPGGAWSESKKSPKASGAEGAAAESAEHKNKSNSPTGTEGAAAGAAAEKRNQPAASGAEGAAAATAAQKNKSNSPTGAEGAAAGAAATKRNQPAATGAEGAAAGVAAANRNKPAATGAEGAALGAATANHQNAGISAAGVAVQNSFHHPGVYNEQWYASHSGAWAAPSWVAGNVWSPTSFAAVNSHCGYGNSTPISYGYGQNVVYQQGNILVNGQNAGTAEEFSQNAADLALVGQNATTTDSDEWLPLGVFALVRDEDQHPQTTVQLAINEKGILRGNYNDIVVDHVLQIHGSVDKQTQRAAWTVNHNKNFFMEAGLTNLTSGEAPTLIHKSGRTERWLLVRLPEQDDAK